MQWAEEDRVSHLSEQNRNKMIQDKLHAHISPSRNLHSRGLITENDMEENGNNNNKKNTYAVLFLRYEVLKGQEGKNVDELSNPVHQSILPSANSH